MYVRMTLLCNLAITDDGNELQFQVNHLSHFLMTLELLPVMTHTATNTGDARIVIVTSKANYTGKFDPKNLNGELSYGPIFNYQNSKLYIVSAFIVERWERFMLMFNRQ